LVLCPLTPDADHTLCFSTTVHMSYLAYYRHSCSLQSDWSVYTVPYDLQIPP